MKKRVSAARTARCGQWVGADLNRRHTDFQSVALPTELPTPRAANRDETAGIEPRFAPMVYIIPLIGGEATAGRQFLSRRRVAIFRRFPLMPVGDGGWGLIEFARNPI